MSNFPLRDYQQDFCNNINSAWESGDIDVTGVLPTGAGKTRAMAELVKTDGVKVIQVHRKELVSQVAMAIAKEGLPHRFIAAKETVTFSTSQQMKKLGYSSYAPNADIVIASAQTLIGRNEHWFDNVRRIFTDEGHHLTNESTWGINRLKFKNAKGLAVTATPCRADGKGLGRHADGFSDRLIIGPDMRSLIGQGHLSDYRLIMAETDLDLTSVMISSATGDYVAPQLKKALQASDIIGDTVATWKQYAEGMLTVVFTDSVDSSDELAKEFRNRGIDADSISSRNSNQERADILERFEQRRTLVLVNCDLFGEGFDCPAMECVIMDRPTESYSLFTQQFGRPLRYAPGKKALIIDKVGNVRRFIARGFPLPDTHYNWSLDSRDRKSGSNTGIDSNTTCTNKGDQLNGIPPCLKPYPAGLSRCPYCGQVPIKIEQHGPERVDGNLRELTPEELEELRRAIIIVERDPNAVRDTMLHAGANQIAAFSAAKNIRELNDAQKTLRNTIALWAGYQRDRGVADSDAYKYFYTDYGIDVLSSQGLGKREATELNQKIIKDMIK